MIQSVHRPCYMQQQCIHPYISAYMTHSRNQKRHRLIKEHTEAVADGPQKAWEGCKVPAVEFQSAIIAWVFMLNAFHIIFLHVALKRGGHEDDGDIYWSCWGVAHTNSEKNMYLYYNIEIKTLMVLMLINEKDQTNIVKLHICNIQLSFPVQPCSIRVHMITHSAANTGITD